MQFSAANKNIGDLLNAKGVTWGFFQGGFKPTATKPDGTAVCGAAHNIGAVLGGTGTSGAQPYGTKPDYIPHHEPFQYYPSTANPHHRPPSSIADDRAHRLRPTTSTTCMTSGPPPTPATCPR